jgi:hypothetical protein
MLAIPELAMPRSRKVTTVCNGRHEVWTNYEEAKAEGWTLEVTKRDVTLTAASDSKAYDGTPLENDEVTVSGSGFVEGEATDIKAVGTIINVGEELNKATFKALDGFKVDNYTITYVDGKLVITVLKLSQDKKILDHLIHFRRLINYNITVKLLALFVIKNIVLQPFSISLNKRYRSLKLMRYI